ncbi:MAG: YceH family protein [Acidobacteriota bacterium]|nr:MAG: YceH family protein [Acidobacteriota bacterium]
MLTKLNDIELRVIGCLVEKELTTPDNYPLTLNSLVAACNQKTNRDPVVDYDESDVESALDSLREKNLAYVFYGSTGRVPKYKHILPSFYELGPAETALITVLMLRGAQTPGELNQRSGRLFEFEGLGEVNETLDSLANREAPLVRKLGRLPGQKEVRFIHLLSETEFDDDEYQEQAARTVEVAAGGLASEILRMREDLDALRAEFEEFKSQFE